MPKPRIEQARDHILNTCLPLVRQHHHTGIIPCLRQDYDDYKAALELEEVKSAILALSIKVELVIVGADGRPEAEIVIATYEDAANGNLERYLKTGHRQPKGFGH